MDENINRFYFSNKEFSFLLVFTVLLMGVIFVDILGETTGFVLYGFIYGILLVTAAIVIGKKYTILALAIARLILEFGFGVELNAIIPFFIGSVVLEVILLTYKPYGENLKTNVIAIIVYSIVIRVLVLAFSLISPNLFITNLSFEFMLLSSIISFGLGAYVGTFLGKEIKEIL